MHITGTPQRPAEAAAAADAGRPLPGRGRAVLRRCLAALGVLAAVALLFVAYLQVSRTSPENSDEANDLLMAWDMLHGNVLLHGWWLSDVSFWTTELPQYALLERLFGLHAATAHIAAAMTYTLVVVVAVLLARGKVPSAGQAASAGQAVGRERLARTLLTGGILLAPQLGVGVFVVLLSLGHIGTAVPLMLTWLVIDRMRARWHVPVLVGLLLAWALLADQLVLLTGVIPLAAVCAMRAAQAAHADRPWRYEACLAAAALAAAGAAWGIAGLLRASGGFMLHAVPYHVAPPGSWTGHAWVTGQGLLAMLGAKPQGPAAALAFAVLHMAGVALLAWAVATVARRFLSWPDRVSQVLLAAIVLNVAAYVPGTLANASPRNAREFAMVLPFGAVLAGRTLAPRVTGAWERRRQRGRAGWTGPALLAVLAGYAASLGYAAAQPSAAPANAQLAQFLAAHHLTYGVSGYWQASIVTVGSDGAVTVRAVQPTLQPDPWESESSWYDSGTHRATFLVTEDKPGFLSYWMPDPAALAAYGRPARTYHVGPYTILVWDKNLLAATG
ncbi:MAG: hypothetical protein JO132_02160 [Streptosporangiaceae bacterium]|nr:hypothetical protein [Streptosporangiaceae bacterium]